jgi:hypothetical protein
MSWYMAVLVRGAHVNGVLDDDRLGDLLYRLIQAEDAEGAYAGALELGAASSDEYDDEDGVKVTLAFLGLADLMEIAADELGHGTEVYSQLLPHKPREMVVEKEELTVFETDDDEDGEDSDESA